MPSTPASLAFHPLCTSHAVISARAPRVWGRATAGDVITVALAGATAQATADAAGHWHADFPPLDAGGPHSLTARNTAGTQITAHDILLGEIWLGSGQSN